MLLRELQPGFGVEPAHEHRLRPAGVVEAHVEHEQPVGVRQRQARERSVDAVDVPRLVAAPAGLPEIRVREHDALRAAGRPAGVDERRQVAVRARDDRQRVAALVLREIGDHANVACGGLDRFEDERRRDHERRLRIADEPAQLIGADEEDHRRDDGARTRDRVVHDADVGRVLHHHDDAIARSHAELDEAARQPGASIEELGRAEPRALEAERVVVAAPLVRLLRELREVASAHRSRIDCPPAACIESSIPAGAAPCGRRSRSSCNSASGSQRDSPAEKSSPASQPRNMFTAPP